MTKNQPTCLYASHIMCKKKTTMMRHSTWYEIHDIYVESSYDSSKGLNRDEWRKFASDLKREK